MWGDGRVFQKQGTSNWWIAYWAPKGDGWKEIRESSFSRNRKDAVKLLRDRMQELANHRKGYRRFAGPEHEKVTVNELIDDLESYLKLHKPKSYGPARAQLNRIRREFGTFRAQALTAMHIRAFVEKRQAEGAKPATINRATEKLKQAYRRGIDDGKIAFAPRIERLAEKNARQGFLPADEFDRLLAHVESVDYRDYFEWLYLTGMRPGAGSALTWDDFDRETWTLILAAKDDKIGRGTPWELTGEYRAVIERRIQARRLGCPWVFHVEGRKIDNHYMRAWKRAETAAGLPHRLVYDLRRTALRNNVRAGTPERVCMTMSGHVTRAVFDRYNIVSGDDLREAVARRANYEERIRMEVAR